jgi:hypothetical protein
MSGAAAREAALNEGSMDLTAPENFVLWCMRRGQQLLEADLLSEQESSSLQLFVNDRLTATAKFPTRAHALACARRLRVSWEMRGWIVMGSTELPGEQDPHDN